MNRCTVCGPVEGGTEHLGTEEHREGLRRRRQDRLEGKPTYQPIEDAAAYMAEHGHTGHPCQHPRCRSFLPGLHLTC